MDHITRVQEVMDEVYGPYVEGHPWVPQGLALGMPRYLWTDAFAVCVFLTLFVSTGDQRYLRQAHALVGAVHDTLGRAKGGGCRLGNATDERPLDGGLRIGKKDPEGTSDGDGHFHYLTKWMLCLNRLSVVTGEQKWNELSVQLAEAVHDRFLYVGRDGQPRMHWKVSTDLSRPLVRSEGSLDPFDGLVTYRLLALSSPGGSALSRQIGEMERMVEARFERYRSDDFLDLGEAMWLTHWFPGDKWAIRMRTVASASLERLHGTGALRYPLDHRLAFREFGTTLGVQVTPQTSESWKGRVSELHALWDKFLFTRDHDITPVMYCASLIPGVLVRGVAEKFREDTHSSLGDEL